MINPECTKCKDLKEKLNSVLNKYWVIYFNEGLTEWGPMGVCLDTLAEAEKLAKDKNAMIFTGEVVKYTKTKPKPIKIEKLSNWSKFCRWLERLV